MGSARRPGDGKTSGSRRPTENAVPEKARVVASHFLLCLSEETPLLPQAPHQAPAWGVLIPKTCILNTARSSEYWLLPSSSLARGCHPPGLLCVWPPWPCTAPSPNPLHAYSFLCQGPGHALLSLGISSVASPMPHLFALQP